MPDERDKMLRGMAQHRGFKLVKSRRRKPGGDFGRYGLTDAATGQDCFGIGKDGLEATADEIEDYLRGAAKATWKHSLGTAGKSAKSAGKKREAPTAELKLQKPKPKPEPAAKPEPEPEPIRLIRDAKPGDAEAIAALVAEAGSKVTAADIAANLRQLIRSGEAPLLAEEGEVVGCAAWHVVPLLHRPEPVGRITLLIVDPAARRRGLGRALIEAAEAKLAERGCGEAEVLSRIEFDNAHGFFRRTGYERTSYRFVKGL